MTWSIEPTSARAICNAVDEHVTDLNPVGEKVTAAFDAVNLAGGTHTASAANDVSFDPFLIQLHAIREYVKAATSGTRSAISAYEAGDLEMAADFEQEASGTQ